MYFCLEKFRKETFFDNFATRDAMCVESSEQTRLMLVHQNSSSLLSRCHRDESFVYDVVGEKSKTRVMDL